MPETTYKRSKARGLGGRWAFAQESVVETPRKARGSRKGRRSVSNTRRGKAGGRANSSRGRKHFTQRH
ncbi:MAG: hypothetical protein HY925_09745 [Elusimicrobia bacterium]|nr:hypothetical protein [Elusimicrobiota bacterium]